MKNRLWLIMILLIIWFGFSDNFQLPNLLLGLFVSFLIPYMVIPKPLDFKVNIWQLLLLALHTIWNLIRSSIDVAWDILTPSNKSQPKIIKLPLDCHHPVQISILANLISLTPGTLAVEIQEENTSLVIHIMFSQRQEVFIDFIKNNLEPKIKKVIQYV